MIEKAYAKCNIALNIVDKREDGFHEIETIILPLKLHDSLDIDISQNKDDFVICDDYSIKIEKYNLCHKAIDLAREKWHFKEHFDINIHKNIFLQSGLGGGSADAAATIRAIIKLLKLNVKENDLIEVATKIGSDVPYMLYNKPSLVTGVGQKIEYFTFKDDSYVLLVKPKEGLSTKEVYENYDNSFKGNCNINEIKKELETHSGNLQKDISNSLEQPAFNLLPILKDTKEELIQAGFDTVFMTGSGSCLVAITKNKKLAKKTEKAYFYKGFQVELTGFLN
ncbi:MAG: 4-(cytidine 5'-diphospho)-2-C-methyl-D-erythritol kinase [Bacilli bacterium]